MEATLTAPMQSGTPGARRTFGVFALAAVLVLMALAQPLAGALRSGGDLAAGKADPALLRAAQAAPASTLPVIVRESRPASADAEGVVRSLGGTVTRELPIIGGFSARVPATSVGSLAETSSVLRLWGDARLHMTGVNMGQYDSASPNTVWRQELKLPQAQAYTGAGVTVAVLDTGVYPNADLGSRLLYHASFAPDVDVTDHFGHGTHMAGIIAGDGTRSGGQYVGVAPRANVVSVKVASPDGATDVSVVIDGLQWVYANRSQYNIRVLNLSFGTDSTQSYLLDPLDYAIEQVWNSGIFVAVAAGNRGPVAGTITKPGDDPYVVTVGAADTGLTSAKSDDSVAPFSSLGPTQDNLAKPDLVAPGISIVSDRCPGCTIDVNHPLARVGDSYFKGTGTSQATAIVSGVAALMFQANPSLTPNVAKAILMGTAGKDFSKQPGAGAGLLDAGGAINSATTQSYTNVPANQGLVPSTGLGTLEGSRGSMHVYTDLNGDGTPDMVTGEIGFNGTAWSGTAWSGTAWSGTAWSGTAWSGTAWSGTAWSGTAWSGTAWSGTAWSGSAWSGTAWSGGTWSGSAWSNDAWS
jgi:serine protease AprX